MKLPVHIRVVIWALRKGMNPLWLNRWPLNRWFELTTSTEELAEADLSEAWVQDTRTGVLFQGTDRIQ
jgi:hypothetical protein